ncbi:HlyD family secretion protein [Psychrobacter lutiphocae]|uniref:HlyD family secretion protein n=1 Tax=Psychrobacter lutiphocae TaxID=540500 RepID=UPI000374C477|nr:HlyD family efflux transporter periplasmic adaptor subunit [Psychrobacter lutiphocae]
MKNKLWLIILLLAVAIIGLFLWQQLHSDSKLPEGIVSSNGRLELERFDIASLYPGRVEDILVEEGEDVEQDQLLAKLSSTQSQSQLTAAQAGEQRAQQLVSQAKAGKAQGEQAVARAEAEIAARVEQQKVAKMELDNARQMRRENLISPSELNKRQAAYNGAVSAVQAARAARSEAVAALGRLDAQISEAQAGVAQARAQETAAASANDDMSIRSPKAGRVEYHIAKVGSVIAAGNKVVSLLDTSDVYMNIFLPNEQMSPLQVGDEARIILDGVDMVWPAEVSYIATEAQFTPKSVETQNEREKLMFKVRLKLPADTALQYKGLLKGGMTGNGYVRSSADVAWPENLQVRLSEASSTATNHASEQASEQSSKQSPKQTTDTNNPSSATTSTTASAANNSTGDNS